MGYLRPLLDGFTYDARMTSWGIDLENVHAWHDGELPQGNPWDGEIKRELLRMDVFVPLISANFFGSWYIQNVELPEAVRRHSAGEIKVAPVLLHDTNLKDKCPFLHQFPRLPPATSWSSHSDKRDAQQIIDDGLWDVIRQVLRDKGFLDP